jgi:hypothetical protein
MDIRIIGVLMSNGKTHEHIIQLRWVQVGSDAAAQWSTRQVMVEFVDKAGNTAFVANGDLSVRVQSVHPAGRAAYVRTYKDGTPTDNLLFLPGGPHWSK